MKVVVITYRTGAVRALELTYGEAADLVMTPTPDIYSLHVVGGCDDWVRSHVPNGAPAAAMERQEHAPCNLDAASPSRERMLKPR